jgi:hypothetical protein
MINNFELIRPLLEFKSEDDFYFIQILQRKKDHKKGKVNGTNNNSRLIKAYYVNSLEYLDFITPEIIELCELFNARAGINLNRRSYEKMALQHLRKCTDQILNKSFNKAYKAYPSVVGAYSNEVDKKWIIDIDPEDIENGWNGPIMADFIDTLQPTGHKTLAVLPSKSGLHVITKPFNLKDFKEKYPNIEVHKNNPTNLYISGGEITEKLTDIELTFITDVLESKRRGYGGEDVVTQNVSFNRTAIYFLIQKLEKLNK